MTTAAVVAYYRQENKATISYAGHPPILYWRKGEKVWTYAKRSERKIPSHGVAPNIPLAIELNTQFEEFTIPMFPGDRLFVYTDGIIDTVDSQGVRFGLGRLKEVLNKNATATLPALKSAVLEALRQYAQKEPMHDDITLMALEIC